MFPEGEVRDKYTTAAQSFRIPYWDWAAAPAPGQSSFPSSVGGSPWIDADGPAGVQTIANPLFSYQFQPLNTTELPNLPVSY
jgi:tyrosinase